MEKAIVASVVHIIFLEFSCDLSINLILPKEKYNNLNIVTHSVLKSYPFKKR